MNTARPPHASRRSGGFTLIELIVVIVIIGILVSFVVMSMNRRSPDDVGVCKARMQSWLAGQAVAANLQDSTVYIQNADNGTDAPSAFVLTDVAMSPGKTSTGTSGLQLKVISHLDWDKDCHIETQASPSLSGLDESDPRARAILAVTREGIWSAPPGDGSSTPVIVVRGQDQKTQSIDLSRDFGQDAAEDALK